MAEQTMAPIAPHHARPRLLLARLAGGKLPGFLLVIALLVLWELSARLGWVQGRAWPPVTVILSATVQGLLNGELLGVFGPSLYRMATGFVIGCGLGFALGVLAGTWAPFSWAMGPTIETIRVLPTPAIVPTMILFLGVDDTLKIVIVAMGAFFPVYINTINGIRGASNVLIDTARTFRLGPFKSLWSVILPSALPAVASGIRIAVGFSLVVTVVAEMISGSSGIGFFIVQTQYALRPEAMYTAVIGLGVVGYTINVLFMATERKFLGWYGTG